MKPRCARNILSIWLALGVITLASCAPVTIPSSSGADPSAQTKLGSASPSAPQVQPHFDSNAPVDSSQSTALTNYLHSHQLPLVGARVLASNGGVRKAIIYGYVATPFGRADASDKVRQWLKDSDALVDNRIKIEPDLAGPAQSQSTQSSMTADNLDLNNPDIQKYEAEQNREQAAQQQQYMSQGSQFGGGGMGMGMGFGSGGGGFTMLLPLLLGGGLGLGGGGMGMGSPMGSSPYGSPSGSPYGGSPYGGSPYGSSPYPSTSPPSGSFFGP